MNSRKELGWQRKNVAQEASQRLLGSVISPYSPRTT